MATLSELTSEIGDSLNRNDLDTMIQTQINRAIQYYKKEHFWFMEEISTFVTVSGQKEYSAGDLPSNFASFDLVQINITGGDQIVEPASIQKVKGLDVDGYLGFPYYYAIYDEKLHFYPTPNDSYTCTLTLTNGVDDLASANDSNAFSNNAANLISARASWFINMRVLKDAEAAQNDKIVELDELESLRETHERMNRVGRLEFHL